MTLPEAQQQGKTVISKADAAADADWKALALDAVFNTCHREPEFICDDVWKIGSLPETRENRAFGAVMQKAARAGWCKRTHRSKPSVRSHGSHKPVWESLIYKA